MAPSYHSSHRGNLLRQFHSVLASRRGRSARNATFSVARNAQRTYRYASRCGLPRAWWFELRAQPEARAEWIWLATWPSMRRQVILLSAWDHVARGLGDGLHDEMVAGAAAQMAGQHLANLPMGRRRMLREKRADAHDDAGRAVAALEPVLGPEGFLNRMQPLPGRDALYGGDLPAVGLNRQHETGANGLAVEEHGAGTAHAMLATDMRPREIEVFANEISQGRTHIRIPRVRHAI